MKNKINSIILKWFLVFTGVSSFLWGSQLLMGYNARHSSITTYNPEPLQLAVICMLIFLMPVVCVFIWGIHIKNHSK